MSPRSGRQKLPDTETANGSERVQHSTCVFDPVATAPGSVTSVARFTGFWFYLAGLPSTEVLGYIHKSASRTSDACYRTASGSERDKDAMLVVLKKPWDGVNPDSSACAFIPVATAPGSVTLSPV